MLSLIPFLALSMASAEAPAISPDTSARAAAMLSGPHGAASEPASSYQRFGAWQFGVSGGSSTGGGLAVRYWWNERNGIEVHGYASFSKDEYPTKDNQGGNYTYSSVDTGFVSKGTVLLGFQYLHEALRLHLFDANGLVKGPSFLRGLLFAGAGGYLDFEDRNLRGTQVQYDPYSSPSKTVPYRQSAYTETKELLGGTGAGLEWELSRFSLHLLLGYGGYYGISSASYEFGPTVDGGIFVRF